MFGMQVEPAITIGPLLIVEDDAAMRQRLQSLVAEVSSGARIESGPDIATAKACLQQIQFGLALIDIGLPDGNGVELIAWIQMHCPGTACVVITSWGDEETVLAALRAGAIGYLLKEREDAELRTALQSIQRGGAPIDPFVAKRILETLSGTGSSQAAVAADSKPAVVDDALTNREEEILRLVARGYSNREIAELTQLSRFTIEGYTKSIYRKLAVRSRTAAVFEAKSLGLLG